MPVLAVGATPEGRTLLFGLSFADIKKLMEGDPITGNLERSTGMKGLDFIIFVGETDESIRADIASSTETATLEKHETAEDLTRKLEEDRLKK